MEDGLLRGTALLSAYVKFGCSVCVCVCVCVCVGGGLVRVERSCDVGE